MSKIKTYTIGRGPKNNLQLDYDSISRLHLEMSVSLENEYFVTDCNSTNGTYLYDQDQWRKIRQSFVRIESKIRLGRHQTNIRELLDNLGL